MILTQLFKHFRVPIHDDEPKRALRHTDVYNLATLRRMCFHKVNVEWTRRSEQTEEGQPAEEPRQVPEETTRVSSPVHPQVQPLEMPSSSSSTAITEERLLQIIKAMFEDHKEYMYESQREMIREIQAFKEEVLKVLNSLQLNQDEKYVKLQKIQDDVNIIMSTQASNIINIRIDLFTLKRSIDDIIQGQTHDRNRIETLVASLEKLLSQPKSSIVKK